ncbi:MAG: hypothetical protein JSS56_07865 [Proteobacteria bacterium]|nr:hypothetical protein [Pseudomonadota bacterium]
MPQAEAAASASRGGSGVALLVFDTGHRRISHKLTLGGRRVTYVNDRTRSRARPGESRPRARAPLPTTGVEQFVRDLARKHHVSYTPTSMDRWAETVTKLAGDEERTGPVQDLLVALKRAGKLSTGDMAWLLVNYLRGRKLSARSL